MPRIPPFSESRFPTRDREEFRTLDDARAWVTRFRGRHGRAPRVLHIGNIANNAYHNSKMLNDIGMDCDVLCYNYYHIMGCPEWEDADFSGSPGDDNAPKWHRVRKRGYRRPKWFAQGRLQTCVAYLKARRQDRTWAARALWQLLELERRNIKQVLLAERVYCGLRRRGGRARLSAATQWKRTLTLLPRTLRKSRTLAARIARRLWHPDLFPMLRKPLQARLERVRQLRLDAHQADVELAAAELAAAELATVEQAAAEHAAAEQAAVERAAAPAPATAPVIEPVAPIPPPPSEFEVLKGELRNSFQDVFPDRPDHLVEEDFAVYGYVPDMLPSLFDEYDVILGYSTDPILPMIAGKRYFALEHGTLRDIPFEADTRGRLTALAYNRAEHVFVTNSDCVDNARKLAGNRVTFINHPFDDRLPPPDRKQFKLRRKLLERLDADHLIFFPTRQDWVAGTGFADKSNDILLRAFAALRRNGLRVGMVCTNWGRNVEESRKLLCDLNVDQYVLWEPPMGMVQFTRTARACGLVADQFKLGAFGGVFYKSMACGVPVCTYLDDETIIERFGAPIPCINVRTEEEIVAALTEAFQTPGRLPHLGQLSREWVDRYHTASETVCKQMRAFAPFLDRLDAPSEDVTERLPLRRAA